MEVRVRSAASGARVKLKVCVMGAGVGDEGGESRGRKCVWNGARKTRSKARIQLSVHTYMRMVQMAKE